ncbi:MAG: pyruvate ferredoxin oxidoreductase subunit alpha [Promethearchaeota archaeon]
MVTPLTEAETLGEEPRGHVAIVSGNHAAAHACKAAKVGVVAAYPITPQSPVVEKISEFVESGQMPGTQFLRVESEQSAIAACVAASATGSRVFTATSANGLAYMNEILAWAAGNRLPLVMCLATRALGAPWSVWTDHQDAISARDTGWIQLFCEDNQEIYDTVLQAYRIAEDPEVYLPVMVNYDGYVLSHTVMQVRLADQADVDRFLPPFGSHVRLADVDHPVGFSPVTTPNPIARGDDVAPGYFEFRAAMQRAHERALDVIAAVNGEFAAVFGRRIGSGHFKTYRMEGADVVLFGAGSVACEARLACDALRDRGVAAGALALRTFRPFPAKQLREALSGASVVVAFDRNVGYGVGGAFATELRAALYGGPRRPRVYGYVVGLGGRDVKPDQLVEGVERAVAMAEAGKEQESTEFLGLAMEVD